MSKLCITLPPFAPDYSGAASALFELGGMIVIHDASGCTGNYTGYDEPRWIGSQTAVYCSALRHMDAVLGNDTKYIKRIVEAAQSIRPAFIAFLGSPVPMIIGTDYEGIAAEVEALTGIPSFGLDTKGLALYGHGVTLANIALLKRFAAKHNAVSSIKIKKIPTVNLLGLTPLDFGNKSNAADFKNLFKSNGIPLAASFSMGISLDDVRRAIEADLNIAVSQSGIKTAQYMQNQYGIPYIVKTPLADGSNLLDSLEIYFGLEGKFTLRKDKKTTAYKKKSGKILIAGEQVIANSIREYAQLYYGADNISVAALFDTEKSLMQKGDTAAATESELRRLIREGDFSVIVADPLVKHLVSDSNVQFFALPHPAVSSKVHWNKTKNYLGIEMDEFIKNIVQGA